MTAPVPCGTGLRRERWAGASPAPTEEDEGCGVLHDAVRGVGYLAAAFRLADFDWGLRDEEAAAMNGGATNARPT
jgi:hypothetical protein